LHFIPPVSSCLINLLHFPLIIYAEIFNLVPMASSYTVLTEGVVKLNIMTDLRVLSYFAHPDDETMFLGGTFAYLASRGAKVHFICATRGEGGDVGDPPICAREELGQVREDELRCAVDVLGGTSLQFSGFIDPEVGPNGELYSFTNNPKKAATKLKDIISDIRPQVILTHGKAGEYGHPAHIQAHKILNLALEKKVDLSPRVYSPGYLSRETGQFIPKPDFLLDISEWKEQKFQAALCHRTQHALFIRSGTRRAGKPVTLPEMIRPIEALSRVQIPGIGDQEGSFEQLLSEISIPLTPGRE
jgi:LmbE family N-acetylglucosaminyl deacetylase